MNDISVEKHCVVVLNVKLQVEVNLKPFIEFRTVINCFRLECNHQNRLFLTKFLFTLETSV